MAMSHASMKWTGRFNDNRTYIDVIGRFCGGVHIPREPWSNVEGGMECNFVMHPGSG